MENKKDNELIEILMSVCQSNTLIAINFKRLKGVSVEFSKNAEDLYTDDEIVEIYEHLSEVYQYGGEMILKFDEDNYKIMPLIFDGGYNPPHSPRNIYIYEPEYGGQACEIPV